MNLRKQAAASKKDLITVMVHVRLHRNTVQKLQLMQNADQIAPVLKQLQWFEVTFPGLIQYSSFNTKTLNQDTGRIAFSNTSLPGN